MNKKLITMLLVACASFAHAKELSDFIADNGVVYAYALLPQSAMTNTVAVGQPDSTVLVTSATYDEQGDLITEEVTRQETVAEWFRVKRPCEDGVWCLCTPSQGVNGRTTCMTTNELAVIVPYMTETFNLSLDDMLTKDEFAAVEFPED